ncbi:hypothetical protein NpPPO83_00010177 [Neofusicoccum parvum]|uniref:Uncharacterized protein n=1 Tax=Neofusicoccum parvum TaxID=310453 RepID=A0ACB5RP71_9PEZI|nr:hypothetical protein NpPPO83_00010177 [Neofusicoccum parvum]
MEFYALKSTIQRRTKDGSYPPLEMLKEVKQQAKESPFGAFDTPAWLEWRIAHPMGNFQPSPAQQPSHAPVGPSHSAPHTTSLKTKPSIKVEETETSTLLLTGQMTEQEKAEKAVRAEVYFQEPSNIRNASFSKAKNSTRNKSSIFFFFYYFVLIVIFS